MKIKNRTIKLQTKKAPEFIDITSEVESFIKETGLKNGQVLIFSKHTTMAIRVNEKESDIFSDFEEFFKKLLPKNNYYHHNDLNIRTENLVCSDGSSECMNGHSHIQHLLLGTSETVPVVGGKIVLGRWQKVFAIELCSPRHREIHLQLIGE